MVFDFLRNFFKSNPTDALPDRVRLDIKNLHLFANFQQLFDDGKIRFDSKGRLRYLHGAPVGDLVLTRVNKDGQRIYKESASEWFGSDTGLAKDFIWP